MKPKPLGKVIIEVSARHVHLCPEDLAKLFGEDYQLGKSKPLSQPGMFAAEERVTLKNKDKSISDVRIVGPCRKQTQVELSLTDGLHLGLKLPIKDSGNLDNTPGITITGSKGKLVLDQGVIASRRHIHISEQEAKQLGLENKQVVWVQTQGPRALIFKNVLVRVDPKFSLSMHIDTDEANAAGIDKQVKGIILKPEQL